MLKFDLNSLGSVEMSKKDKTFMLIEFKLKLVKSKMKCANRK